MNQEPKKFVMPAKLKGSLTAMLAVGVLCFIIGLNTDASRAWGNFLVNHFFWTAISLGSVFFVALQYVSGSSWSAPLRRIAEVLLAYLPVSIVMFFILLFGTHTLYEWTHHEVVANDHILSMKTAYLNVPFFAVRNLITLGVGLFVGFLLLKNSLKQDKTGEIKFSKINTAISAPFILFFAWSFTFMSFDLIMSLSPHWFSTIFGVYCWAILILSVLATIAILVIMLRRAGYLEGYITQEHYHALGKLLFGFVVFWTYIAFSQFMLIWYADLPEETGYYLTRLANGWEGLTISFVIIKFVFPFFLLTTQRAKRNENVLLFASIWILLVQWIDVYWLVFPSLDHAGHGPVFGWVEVGMFAGFAGLFFLSVSKLLEKVAPVAHKDVFLHEGVHHHQ